jgi:hypothetical protein
VSWGSAHSAHTLLVRVYYIYACIYRVGKNHTFMGIYGVYTVFLAGKSPYIRSYTVCIYNSGQPYVYTCVVKPDRGVCICLISMHPQLVSQKILCTLNDKKCPVFDIQDAPMLTYVRRFRKEHRRHFYVTPTSYLQLLDCFKMLLARKREEVAGARRRCVCMVVLCRS